MVYFLSAIPGLTTCRGGFWSRVNQTNLTTTPSMPNLSPKDGNRLYLGAQTVEGRLTQYPVGIRQVIIMLDLTMNGKLAFVSCQDRSGSFALDEISSLSLFWFWCFR
jgi:hypothetical protein